MAYHQDKTFDNQDYTQAPLAAGEYDHCVFQHCNFADTDLSVDCKSVFGNFLNNSSGRI